MLFSFFYFYIFYFESPKGIHCLSEEACMQPAGGFEIRSLFTKETNKNT